MFFLNKNRKLWWVNPELSLAFGHLDIPLRLGCENHRNAKRERKQILDDLTQIFHTTKRNVDIVFHQEENK